MNTTATTWRVFCAVELPPEVRVKLKDHIERLRTEVPDTAASWSRVENIHLTLKFFGSVDIDRITVISAALDRAVKNFSPFEISVDGTGAFRTQVLWIGVSDPADKLSALHNQIEDECAAEGFEKEDRAYRPHLTVARIRNPKGARHLIDAHKQMNFETVPVETKELILFRSELSPKGSRYTAISKHRLGG